jgi:DHA2 family multidrug resistance protein
VTFAVLAAAGLIALVMRELMARHPVIDLRVFKDRTYATGTFLMTALGFVLYGSLVLLPIWLQTLLGYPSLEAGLALAPRGLGAFLTMPLVGAMMSKVDARKFLAAGLLIASATLFAFARLDLNAGYWDFFWPQFIQGISLSFLFVPLTTITMGSIPRDQMGNATAIFNVLRNIGGGIGIAAVTTLVARYTQVHINILGSHVTPYSPQARAMLDSMTHTLGSYQKGYAGVFGFVQRHALILTYLDVFRLLGFVFLAMVPLVLLMRRPKGGGPVAAH